MKQIVRSIPLPVNHHGTILRKLPKGTKVWGVCQRDRSEISIVIAHEADAQGEADSFIFSVVRDGGRLDTSGLKSYVGSVVRPPTTLHVFFQEKSIDETEETSHGDGERDRPDGTDDHGSEDGGTTHCEIDGPDSEAKRRGFFVADSGQG